MFAVFAKKNGSGVLNGVKSKELNAKGEEPTLDGCSQARSLIQPSDE